MVKMIQLTCQPICTDAILTRVGSPQAGAVVLFLGSVREMTDGRRTVMLEYESYHDMAERKLVELEAEARARWPLIECVIVHRTGALQLGETSVAVATSAPHRDDAFEAAHWLIDTLKQVVPIWKKEHWADGTSEWIHPQLGSNGPAVPSARDRVPLRGDDSRSQP